jgi:hypothetical protein
VVRGTVEGDQEPGWIADPEEIVDIQWLDPTALTEDRVQWFHWSNLKSLGLVG